LEQTLSSTFADSNTLLPAARTPIERTRRTTAIRPARASLRGPAARLRRPGPVH